MSYDIIKQIKITPDKVFISAASNNVSPRTYRLEEVPRMSEMLREKGREAVDVYILEAYEKGTFQGGNNKYTRALLVLHHMPEYKKYDWRGDWDATKDARDNDKDGYRELLRKALTTRLPSEAYVITKNTEYDVKVFLKHKRGTRIGRWYPSIAHATIYKFHNDAENVKGYFSNNNADWQIEKI